MNGAIVYITYCLLTVTEMVLIQNLYIFKYSRIASINEYFLTFVLTSFNMVIVFGSLVIRIILKQHETNPLYALHFNPIGYASQQSSLVL